MAFCATDARVAPDGQAEPIGDVLQRIEEDPDFDLGVLRDFYHRTPAENALWHGAGREGSPIQHGLAIRLLIPYRDAEITHLALNGQPLVESPCDGYQLRRDPGTVIQVNIPPGAVQPLHIVTCAYEEASGRQSGFTEDDWQLD